MAGDIDTIRKLLASKPRPTGWAERRQRIDEVGSTWPVAPDITRTPAELGSVSGEWTSAPDIDPSRVLLFFHGGGFCSGSVISHRRLASEAGRAAGTRSLAIDYRRAAGAANVAVTLEIWPRMIHAWPVWNGGLAEGREAIARAGQFIRQHLQAASSEGASPPA